MNIQESKTLIKSKVTWSMKNISLLLMVSLLVAVVSHLYYIVEWLQGTYLVGPGDGISQMLPIKKLLYDEYTKGNFFYSTEFGMGGGIFSQLGYYFSTSIVFLLTVCVTYGLEMFGLIQHPDIFYWADVMLFVSIIRLTAIIAVTTMFFHYIRLNKLPAFIGATIYGTSIIYFRHVVFWEFFADAMLWLPILLFGVEKIIREKKVHLFTFAVAINLFTNFYFAYINFLLTGIYIIFRWLIPLTKKETSVGKQIRMYLLSGIAGFGISAVSFIPAVYGYLNNYRPAYNDPIALLQIPDNFLLHGRIIVLPAFVLLSLFLISFYKKNRLFRFFASLTILTVFMHLCPKIASVFNGFSAPQYRWEYFMTFVAGGVIASVLQAIHQIKRRDVTLAFIGVIPIYLVAFLLDKRFSHFSFSNYYLVIVCLLTLIVWACLYTKPNKRLIGLVAITLVVFSVFTSNVYQNVRLSKAKVTADYLKSDAYNGSDQLALVNQIKKEESLYRIDWMNGVRNNTPMMQDFNGFSAYSSILNKQLLYFYYYDLEIDMRRESVSRYASLGNRANLYSVLGGKYYIAEKEQKAIPYGFEKYLTQGNYVAYKNKNILPFIRSTSKVYDANDLVHASPVAKERAMIDGVILKSPSKSDQIAVPQDSENIVHEIHPVDATYQNNELRIFKEHGGLDLIVEDSNSKTKDYFLSFVLKRVDKDEGYDLHVNEYCTTRKKKSSIYRTGIDKVTVRIQKADKISIRLPKGTYQVSDIELFGEDYQLLESYAQGNNKVTNIPVEWNNNHVHVEFDNSSGEKYLVLPIPYEKGWQAYNNGEESEILEANYAFMGISLHSGSNDIKLVYYPPYFVLSLCISLLSILGIVAFLNRKKMRNLFQRKRRIPRE